MNVRWESSEAWVLDSVHFSRPVSPLMCSYGLDTVGPGTELGFAEWSLPFRRYRVAPINGWAYARADPVGREPPAIVLRFPPLAHLWRLHPRLRRRILGFDRFIRDGGFERSVGRWHDEWRPAAVERLAVLRSFDLADSSDDELADHLGALREFMVWQWSVHLNIHIMCSYIRGRFLQVCEELLGLTEFEAYELVQRTDPFHFEGTARLAAIARRVREDAAVGQALAKPAGEALEELRGTWFEQELNGFLDALGDRAATFELVDPTWREMPELVVRMVKDLLDSGYDPEAEEIRFEAQRRASIEALRGRLAGEERARFEHWLELGERAYPLNETHNYLLTELPLGLLRYAALEAGARLHARSTLDAVDDVFFLRHEELTAALRGEALPPEELATSRRADYRRAAGLRPPQYIRRPLTPPPLHVFPPAVAFALNALLAQFADTLGRAERTGSGDTLTGVPGGPGVAEGPARIVRTLEEFPKVNPGDVLVCPYTNPAWTVVFPSVAAVVADSGGALSHAAIIAREYGLPAVVGTLDASRRLEDGQRIVVDGNAGTVRILASGATTPLA
jgi:phosphohistidine swiveling domain-containing protein